MLLVLDECQTGLGRLGALYGFEIYDVVPDFLTLSKTLGGGVPISATLTSAQIEQSCFERGFIHVTSHVSDPMPAAAAEAVLDVVLGEDLAAAARKQGQRLVDGLRDIQGRHEAVGDVRGMGLLCGVELVENRDTRAPADTLGHAVTDECLRCGLSINLVRGQTAGSANCLRLAPPLTISDDEIDLGLTILDEALTTVTARPSASAGAVAAGQA
jgi:2,2-dialkylglycine decarboxylase (pyruvate)